MRLTLALLFFLSACVHAPNTADRAAIESSGRAWRASQLPPAGDCLSNVVEVKRHSDYAEFKDACHNPFAFSSDPRTLTGCATSGFSHVPWKAVQYTLHIAPGNPHEMSTVRHEACHVLVMCTNLHPNGDALHTDTRVWKTGGPDSVEARANGD